MTDLILARGTTSQAVQFFIQDTRQSDGSGLTGLVFNTAGLTAYYIREGAASAVQITLATMTVGTWATGGFVAADGTNLPGVYELSIPDAALATGAKWVTVMLKGAANMAVAMKEIELTGIDLNAAGVTVTTNNDKSAYTLASNAVDAAQFTQAAADKVWTSAARTLTAFSTALAQSVWDCLTASSVTVASFGVKLKNWALGSDSRALVTADAHTSGETVAAVVGAVGAVTAGVTVTTNNDKTGYALTAGERTAITTAILATALVELAQAQPSATPVINDALMFLYMYLRNGRTTTASLDTLQNNAGTVIAKSTLSDDGTTFTRAKMVSGP